jgi:hypothetical protein
MSARVIAFDPFVPLESLSWHLVAAAFVSLPRDEAV